ncbi:Uncharacterised protein [Mycobacteroides abscessus subsp. abscessus]|nr:Uncharacterised protein [Mycobacteroides abscessus subsp. abscessus]
MALSMLVTSSAISPSSSAEYRSAGLRMLQRSCPALSSAYTSAFNLLASPFSCLLISTEAAFSFWRGPYSSVSGLSSRISFPSFLKNPCPDLLPSQPFSSICFMNAGTSKASFSLPSTCSYTLFATWMNVSSPTTSRVRNVALFGLPIRGPVTESTSPTL